MIAKNADQRQHQPDAELLPVRVADVEPIQQPALLRLAERNDLVVPERVRGVPCQSQLGEQRALAHEAARQRLAALGKRGLESLLDALGRDRGCRIDAHPAALFEPHLRPGVRLRLAHQQVAARAG